MYTRTGQQTTARLVLCIGSPCRLPRGRGRGYRPTFFINNNNTTVPSRLISHQLNTGADITQHVQVRWFHFQIFISRYFLKKFQVRKEFWTLKLVLFLCYFAKRTRLSNEDFFFEHSGPSWSLLPNKFFPPVDNIVSSRFLPPVGRFDFGPVFDLMGLFSTTNLVVQSWNLLNYHFISQSHFLRTLAENSKNRHFW